MLKQAKFIRVQPINETDSAKVRRHVNLHKFFHDLWYSYMSQHLYARENYGVLRGVVGYLYGTVSIKNINYP